jgi:CBS domain-containing protein
MSASPSPSLLANLRAELSRVPPFAQMDTQALDFFLTRSEQRYYAPDEVITTPDDGPVRELFFIRSGAVVGERGSGDARTSAFEYERGDLFPVSAAVAQRAVTARYKAVQDTFVLVLPVAAMRDLSARSAPFADFLNRRIQKFLELSRRELQVAYSSQTLAEQSLETPLGTLATRAPVACRPDTPLREALSTMHARRIGSVLVTDEAGHPLGILTRYDVLGRVLLAGVPLDAPMSQVMVQPVRSLTTEHTAQDAALLMSRHGIRHVPVTRDGVAVGIVSERDLFAMQRLSLKQVSTGIRAAQDVESLRLTAQEIRRFAHNLLSQGVQARQLTALISHLNDVLTERLLQVLAAQHGVELSRICWLALGSEGRSEQTIATDQDNALILPDDATPAFAEQVRLFARAVNLALDQCGYPLCKGGIMAGEQGGAVTLREWRERFAAWIDHGAPQDLLNASIYFDFRCLAGDASLAEALRSEVVEAARRTPRFLKQMALNALQHGAPLNWLGSIDTDDQGTVDLKLQGTAIFVDAARLYALAHGLSATGTRERLEAVGRLLGLPESEFGGWVGGFEFLQMLRLRVQLEAGPSRQRGQGTTAPAADNPNRMGVARLNDIDRRILKESLRVARSLQQRLHLDYER